MPKFIKLLQLFCLLAVVSGAAVVMSAVGVLVVGGGVVVTTGAGVVTFGAGVVTGAVVVSGGWVVVLGSKKGSCSGMITPSHSVAIMRSPETISKILVRPVVSSNFK